MNPSFAVSAATQEPPIIRDSRSSISEVTIVTKQQCRELADRHMNVSVK